MYKNNLFVLLFIVVGLSACGAPKAAENKPATVAAAKVEHPVKEADLATIKLTPQAEQRLGIETVAIEQRMVARTRDYSGEIMLPPDRTMIVTAPFAGQLSAPDNAAAMNVGSFVRQGQPLFRVTPYLTPERDLRPQLERDVASATEKLNAAKLRFDRAQQLLEGQAGSVKNVEQTREEVALAENDLKAAQARLTIFNRDPLNADVSVTVTAPIGGLIQKVHTTAGQATTGGAALIEITNLGNVWVRVPVYVGELNQLSRKAAARVHGLSDAPGTPTRQARPVAAPPSANALASTADLYFSLSNGDGSLRPGQRVAVTLNQHGAEESLVVPWSAILHDIHGGAWVYESSGAQTFVRRPVEVRYITDGQAVLARGPAVGTKVVTAGAAELFGTEFGVGK